MQAFKTILTTLALCLLATPVTASELIVNEAAGVNICVANAQAIHKNSLGQAALYMNQGLRACYDIMDMGHPVPGSVCIKRVEDNYKQDVAAADQALATALAACPANN